MVNEHENAFAFAQAVLLHAVLFPSRSLTVTSPQQLYCSYDDEQCNGSTERATQSLRDNQSTKSPSAFHRSVWLP